jgi:hypothetical protein
VQNKKILAILLSTLIIGAAGLMAHERGRVRFSLGLEAGASFSTGYMRQHYNKSFWGINFDAVFGSTEQAWNIRAGLGIHHILGTAIEWASLNRAFPGVTQENITPWMTKDSTGPSRVDSFCFRLGAAWYPIKGNRAFYAGGGVTLAESEEAYGSSANIYYTDGTNDSGYANGIWSGGIGAHVFAGYQPGLLGLEIMCEIVPHGWGTPAVSLSVLTLSLNYRF